MAKYAYQAKEGPVKVVNGTIDADSADSAVERILKLGVIPVDVHEISEDEQVAQVNSRLRPLLWIPRVRFGAVVEFTRQMSDLIGAAVPVIRGLQLVERQIRNENFRQVVHEMFLHVRDGGALSGALARYPDIFSQFYIYLVRTGEASGRLDDVFRRLAQCMEKDQDYRQKIRSSLAYPALIFVVGILTVFVLMSYVIPKLTVMFDDLGQELPWMTTTLIHVSGFFGRFWWAILLGTVVVCYYAARWLSTSSGRYWKDSVVLRIPVLGRFVRTLEVGRFSRTLAALVETGIVMTSALQSVSSTVENTVLKAELQQAAAEVMNGASLKGSLQNSRFFPELAVNMIGVGEETGELDKSLYKVADIFERQGDQDMKTLVSLLGPLVLIVIVSLVGFMVIAMLLPILNMNLLIQ